jgi:alpha-galactosidase
VADLFHLKRAGVSVVIETSAGTPNIVHWGSELSGDLDEKSVLSAIHEPTPHCDFDDPQLVGIWREDSRGFLGAPTIIGSRDGLDFSQHFTLRDVNKKSEFEIEFISIDADAELEVAATFSLQPSGLLEVQQRITNLGLNSFKLDSLTTWLPLPDYVAEQIDFTGRWMNERQPQRKQIQTGTWLREGREGRSGHDFTLLECALSNGTNFDRGEIWALSLAWSGNSRHLIERTPIGRTTIGAGELLLPGEVILGKEESYFAPRVIGAYSNEGIDGVSHRLHSQQRSRPNHPTNIRPRPVTLNVWEAVYFDHNLEKLAELAKVAGEIGVERFVLDDGWFGSRRDDSSGLGDWSVSTDVWPNGLSPLIDAVKANGMEFGLWFEGEMVNQDSHLYREHPEWILQAGGRVPPTFRSQQVLDLAHEGAFNHVLGQVDAILSEYDIAYIKWDHNRVLTEAANFGRPAVRKQVEAIYRLFDELKSRHSGLEIESCASGGGRIDLEMIEHADRFWTSDNNDALERQNINRYTTIAIAPELLGTHIGPTKAHSSGRTHTHTFRATTALWGHAGLEWDLTEASKEERELLASWISYYKEKRGLLHSGRTIRTEHAEPNAYVHGVVSQDKSEAIFMFAQLRPSQFSRPANIRLTGLDADSTYEVKVVEPAGVAQSMQLKPPTWFSGVKLTGSALASFGLRSPVLRPEQALLIEVKRIK